MTRVEDDITLVLFPGKEFVNLKGCSQLRIVRLPHPKTLKSVQYLYDEKEKKLFELKKMTFDNPHQPSQVRKTARGEVLRSLMFCPADTRKTLFVESSDILVATPFNPVYFLLSFFAPQLEKCEYESSNPRLKTFDDLIEDWMDDSSSLQKLPVLEDESSSRKLLAAISESVEEGGETYHKISVEKIMLFLNEKLQAICCAFPDSILQQLVTPDLTSPLSSVSGERIPEELVAAFKHRHAIHLLGSYLHSYYIEKLYETAPNSVVLNSHLKLVQQQVLEQKLAEENLQKLNESLSNEKKRKGNQKGNAKTKKPAQKVAMGKGALDSFFKKA